MFGATNLIGNQPINFWFDADTTERQQHGMMLDAVSEYWGGGEFIYAKASATIGNKGLCTILPVFDSTNKYWRYDAAPVANTANLGRMVAVACVGMASGDYGWFQISGLTPINGTASVAADTAFGITAAGQIGANSAGKQILNARIAAAATTTVVKAGVATSGSTQLIVPDANGWFIGVFLSGTGIAAGTTVSAVDPSGRIVTLSAATTAAVNGNVTATYNDATTFYNVAYINRPFAQGAIT